RVLACREKLRQPHIGQRAVDSPLLEDVILRDDATWRQGTSRSCDRLRCPPQPDLLLEQAIARSPVLHRLTWKCNGHCHLASSIAGILDGARGQRVYLDHPAARGVSRSSQVDE